jgi:uncharacterized membrane protein
LENSKNRRLLIKVWAWLIPVLTPAMVSTLIAAIFLWGHLLRTGHTELFFDSVSFSSFFGYLFFFAGVSIVAFCLLIFMPSLMAGLFISSVGERDDQKRELEEKNIGIVIITALLSVLVIFGYYMISLFTGEKIQQNVSIQMLIILAISIVMTVIFNRTITRVKISGATWQSKVKVLFFMHCFQPLLIACAACIYVFPLEIFLKYLEFPEGTSEIRQTGTVIAISMFVIVFSFIPGIVFLRLRAQSSLIRMVALISGIMAAMLFVMSVLVSAVPALILTLFLRMSGVIDLTPKIYGVPVANYPEEYFSDPGWNARRSKDGKTYLLQAVKLYSLGNIRLLCPPELATVYKKSLRYQILDIHYDESLRGQLQESASHCRKVDGGTLLMMEKLPAPENPAKT